MEISKARELKAHLICNNKEKKTKVLNEINKNLLKCDSFSFSVAFINDSGLQCIKQTLYDLEKRKVKGRLITSTYLGFNNPKMFKELLKFKNIDIRIFEDEGFHPKGYIFNIKDERNIIIGSSNITASALTTNQEWNICLNSIANEDIVERVNEEFEDQWNHSINLTKEWISKYEEVYVPVESRSFTNSLKNTALEPNSMQTEALFSLNSLRQEGKDKALLISATGTGKTFLSAFDVKQFNANRVLFIIHRENIAKKAMESFKTIMPNKKYGMFSGTHKDYDADYMFATIQTIGKHEYLQQFDRQHFDYIIIDEVHHLGADTYQTIFDYFKPKFLLGMTATPERTDGYDIYQKFDYNIAYEIRLQQAMEEDLLCPFHYFGISDIKIDGEDLNDDSDIKYLACEDRVNHIIEASDKYSYFGDKVHGLIFVSRVDEANKISSLLNAKGFKTAAVTGETTNVEEAIDKLESDDKNNCYDYLVCVDKFNEGIDIPKVNQIIMARPTSSAIIFVQQLGRGLRKADDKEYTVIIDMIGNYKNNYMIPVALSGDRTYSIDVINRYMISGMQFLPGSSTISFDEIAREKIFDSIEKISRVNDLINKSYETLLFKLGRRPYLIDFYKEKEVDPMVIISKNKSYYKMAKNNCDDLPEFSPEMIASLEYLSKTILDGKRNVELEMFRYLIKYKKIETVKLYEDIKNICNCSDDVINSAINILQGKFVFNKNELKKNEDFTMIESNDVFTELTDKFDKRLENDEYKLEILDIIDTGLCYYNDNYVSDSNDPFILNKKYSRRDVSRLLNAPTDLSSTMFGMSRIDDDVCLFVTYKKQDPEDEKNYIEGKPDYADSFKDEFTFEWMTQIGQGKDSEYWKKVKTAKNIRLFIQKRSSDIDFYYLGKVSIVKFDEEQKKNNKGIMKDILRVTFFMDNPVEKELLDYFRSYEYTLLN